jgi:Flp pilus assembly protein TadD
MGISQVRLGQHYLAVLMFRKATEINPKMSIAHTNLGLGLINLERYE